MNRIFFVLGSALACSLICVPVFAASPLPLQSFLDQHCGTCHSGDDAEADRRFDPLPTDLSSEATLVLWQEILDQLNLGAMPPEDQPQPKTGELLDAVAAFTSQIHEARQHSASGKETALRRLNRHEYLNTIRDLFALDMTMFDPTDSFPEDDERDGFDNQGDVLITSGYLLDLYFQSAEKIVEKAIQSGGPPESQSWTLRPPFDRTTNEHSGWVTHERRRTKQYQSIFQGVHERFGYRPLDDWFDGAPHDGYYRVRVKACGLNRIHPYADTESGRQLIGTDINEPIQLALVSGSPAYGTMHLRQSIESTLAVLDLPDDQPQWVEATVWLDRGFQPRLTYHNGPYFFKTLPHVIHRIYPELFPVKLDYGNWWDVCQQIHTPQVRIFEVNIEGPLEASWPPESHRIAVGGEDFDPRQAHRVIGRFATRAFRRPVRKDELDSLLNLYQAQLADQTAIEAFKVTLKAILCSPSFLYLEEPTVDESTHADTLSPFALASRLSYFLWSSIPDEELLASAASGKLTAPDELRRQARRMLADPRGREFTHRFVDRWLGLYKLGEMPPDPGVFKWYYVGNLRSAMRGETERFFSSILNENHPIEDLIDATYTFVNRPLAVHYGIDYDVAVDRGGRVDDDGFVRVGLDDARRGGLLTQASVLTATANGIDTSPVIRGVWVLDNILGTPPSPPPSDIEPLEPDTRGAKTIREQLASHRQGTTCYACHQKIDPLGFALETFDAVGAIRRNYPKQKKEIDSSGKLPSGESFGSVVELKRILAEHPERFTRCLTEKLLSYATGRELTVYDRGDVDDIVRQSLESENRLRDLVEAVVLSQTFCRP